MSEPTYGRTIDPERYNRFMEQHVYLPETDQALLRIIAQEIKNKGHPTTRILEVGCGPGKFTRKLGALPHTRLDAVDHDGRFLAHAQTIVPGATFHKLDVTSEPLPGDMDIVISLGMHHHIAKGGPVDAYLRGVLKALKPGGLFLLADEVLAPYTNEGKRASATTMWHAHVITRALQSGHTGLATMEAQTLLDDIVGKPTAENPKSQAQIDQVLESVEAIDEASMRADLALARARAETLLRQVQEAAPGELTGNPELDLSRGDRKVHTRDVLEEVTRAGFRLDTVESVGPVDIIGGLAILLLRAA